MDQTNANEKFGACDNLNINLLNKRPSEEPQLANSLQHVFNVKSENESNDYNPDQEQCESAANHHSANSCDDQDASFSGVAALKVNDNSGGETINSAVQVDEKSNIKTNDIKMNDGGHNESVNADNQSELNGITKTIFKWNKFSGSEPYCSSSSSQNEEKSEVTYFNEVAALKVNDNSSGETINSAVQVDEKSNIITDDIKMNDGGHDESVNADNQSELNGITKTIFKWNDFSGSELYCSSSSSQSEVKSEESCALKLGDNSSGSGVDRTLNIYSDDQSELKTVAETIFKCELCDGKTFTRRCRYMLHMRKHVEEKPLKCAFCDKRFWYNSKLELHERTHTGEKPFKCSVCDRSFRQMYDLSIHTRTHTGDEPFACGECGRTFNRSDHLKVHMRVHTTDKPYECKECGKFFRHDSNLQKHMRLHTGERPFKCTLCDADFTQSGGLTNHMRKHTGEKPFACDQCEKSFRYQSDLSKHLRQHAGVNRYVCEHCEKGFDSISHLHIHVRMHTGERPFACRECGKAFADRSHLYQHERTHSGVTPFECGVCKKTYKDSRNFKNHMRTHTGEENPFVCGICGKGFSGKSHLSRHMRTHTGEKPYACAECGKQFGQKGHLSNHMKMHNGDMAFECTECEKRFVQKCNLQMHMKKYHPATFATAAGSTATTSTATSCEEDPDVTTHQDVSLDVNDFMEHSGTGEIEGE